MQRILILILSSSLIACNSAPKEEYYLQHPEVLEQDYRDCQSKICSIYCQQVNMVYLKYKKSSKEQRSLISDID